MFDVGFWELLLIGGLALVILGPERLPKVAREVGRWVGRARTMARQLRSQLEQEVSYDEYMKTQGSRAPTQPPPAPPPTGQQPDAAGNETPEQSGDTASTARHE